MSKTIVVYSSDSQNPTQNLKLTGKIKGIDCRPSKYAYFFVNQGQSDTKEIELFTIEETLNSVEATSNNPYVSVAVENVPQKSQNSESEGPLPEYRLRLTLSDKAPIGRINGVVNVKTDSKFSPNLDIRLNGEVRPRIMVTPKSVGIFIKQDGTHSQCSFRINSTNQEPIKILNAKSSNDKLKISMNEEDQPGTNFKFTLNWEGGTIENTRREFITVTTNDKQFRELKVPVVISQSQR